MRLEEVIEFIGRHITGNAGVHQARTRKVTIMKDIDEGLGGTHCSDAIPEGYKHHGYAALPLCVEYIRQNEGDVCVHCKWFEMDEPATVYVKRSPQVSKDDAVANVSGKCVRFPPRLFVGSDPHDYDSDRSDWPSVDGEDRCGEFTEQRRCGEEICLAEFCD